MIEGIRPRRRFTPCLATSRSPSSQKRGWAAPRPPATRVGHWTYDFWSARSEDGGVGRPPEVDHRLGALDAAVDASPIAAEVWPPSQSIACAFARPRPSRPRSTPGARSPEVDGWVPHGPSLAAYFGLAPDRLLSSRNRAKGAPLVWAPPPSRPHRRWIRRRRAMVAKAHCRPPPRP